MVLDNFIGKIWCQPEGFELIERIRGLSKFDHGPIDVLGVVGSNTGRYKVDFHSRNLNYRGNISKLVNSSIQLLSSNYLL